MQLRLIVCTLVVLLPRDAAAGNQDLPRPRAHETLLDQLDLPEPGEDPAERARINLRRRQQARAELWLKLMGIRPEFVSRVSALFPAREPRNLYLPPPQAATQAQNQPRECHRSKMP